MDEVERQLVQQDEDTLPSEESRPLPFRRRGIRREISAECLPMETQTFSSVERPVKATT